MLNTFIDFNLRTVPTMFINFNVFVKSSPTLVSPTNYYPFVLLFFEIYSDILSIKLISDVSEVSFCLRFGILACN